MLLNLWSVDCAPCLSELADLASHHADLEEHGLTVVPLCVDTDEAGARARAFYLERIVPTVTGLGPQARTLDESTSAVLDALLAHCLGSRHRGALPTSLLIDHAGWLQVIYLGPVTADALIRDAEVYAPGPRGAVARSGWGGRWFFGVPRDLTGLSKELAERGRPQEARFYELLDRREGK